MRESVLSETLEYRHPRPIPGLKRSDRSPQLSGSWGGGRKESKRHVCTRSRADLTHDHAESGGFFSCGRSQVEPQRRSCSSMAVGGMLAAVRLLILQSLQSSDRAPGEECPAGKREQLISPVEELGGWVTPEPKQAALPFTPEPAGAPAKSQDSGKEQSVELQMLSHLGPGHHTTRRHLQERRPWGETETEASSPRSPRATRSAMLSLDARLGGDTRLCAKVLFTALYSLIFALRTAGNALSGHVVLKVLAGPRVACTNVLSLALPALWLLLLVSLPMELLSLMLFHYPRVFGDPGCRGWYFVRQLCVDDTVVSVASLSAEHCPAVGRPLGAHRLLTRRPRSLLLLGWVPSLGLALPIAVIMGQKHELETVSEESEPASRVNVLVPFVLPLALSFLNRVTVNHLVSLCSQMPSTSAPDDSAPRRLELMSKEGLSRFSTWRNMLSLTGQANQLHHAYRLMYCYITDDRWTDTVYDFYHYFCMVTNMLFYVTSAVTPVLYNTVSSSFRKLFLEAVSSLC
ncbi:LOW QUALITY PROTEIN: neurotensin receptor type 2 [Dugong dugon]